MNEKLCSPMNEKLFAKLHRARMEPSDINEHITTMLQYAMHCEHITEMGVCKICSTWAWICGKPKRVVAYDINHPSKWGCDIQEVYDLSHEHGVDFEFIQADVLKIEIEETDLLFLDTWHTYDQVKRELELHANKVRHFIMFHDTTSFEFCNESSEHENTWEGEMTKQGVWRAIEEFLYENREWTLHERLRSNFGLTVIRRRSQQD